MRSLTTTSNSNVYSDGWDSDFYGDDDDHKNLMSMNELDREAVLYERSQSRLLRKEQKMMREKLKERDDSKKMKGDLRKEKLEELKLKRKYSKETSSSIFDARIEDGEVAFSEKKPKEYLGMDLNIVNQLRVSRNKIEKWIFHPKFDSLMENSLARIAISSSENEQLYRLVKIMKTVKYHRTYNVGSIKTDKAALVCYGKSQKIFCFDIFSNGDFTDAEYNHWLATLKSESISPSIGMEMALKKISDWKKFEQEPITEQILSDMIHAKSESKRLPKNLLTEKAILLHKLQVASMSSDSLDDRIDTLKQLEYIEKRRGEASSGSNASLETGYKKKKGNGNSKPTKLSSLNKMMKSTTGGDNLDPFSRRKCRPVNYNDFGEEANKNDDPGKIIKNNNAKESNASSPDQIAEIDLDI